MENSFQTSFIPKKPIDSNVVGSKRAPASIFGVVSTIILIVVVLFAGGFFVYKNVLTKQKDSLSASLVKIRNSFDKDTINELELFDKRVSIAKTILGDHIVFSKVFEMIGDLTIPSIQFTSFDHETVDGVFLVKMSGISRDYRSIALQADVFNTTKGRYFKNVVFSNLIKNEKNYILFDVEFNVDPSLLTYTENISTSQSSETSTQEESSLPDNKNTN